MAYPSYAPEKNPNDFIPPPPTENASIKWPVQSKTPEKIRIYEVDWPTLYAPEKNPNDVGWTTLYRLPSRECLYKVACPSYTPEKISL